jgi:hypothetical protein
MKTSLLMALLYICAAIFLTGCYTVTEVSHELGSKDDKIIMGYGRSAVIEEATKMAWKDAREKLEISGLEDYYGLTEAACQYKASTAVITFKLVPLKDFDTTEQDSNDDGTKGLEP